MNGEERNLEARARQAFDDSVEQLDGAMRSRLTQARHRALAAGRQRLAPGWGWMSASAAAAATLLAVMLWTPAGPGRPESPALAATEDFELLTSGEELAMFDEDAEFYAWAEDQGATGGIG